MLKKVFMSFVALVAIAAAATGPARAQSPVTETFSYSDYQGQGTQSSGSEYTMTKTDVPVSITETKFYCSTDYANAQFYAGGVATITPAAGVTVTQVVISAVSESYNGYQSNGTITASTGEVGHNGTTITWTGSATSAFTLSHSKQIRWTTIVVTYTPAQQGGSSSSEPATYTVTFAGFAYDYLNNTTVDNATLPYVVNQINGDYFSPSNVMDDGESFSSASVTSGGNGMVSASVSSDLLTITITGAFEGTATIHCEGEGMWGGASRDVYVTCVANVVPQLYTVKMAPGTEDSTSWTFNPGEAPTDGVAEGTTVNISYTGTRKVKSVVATVAPSAPQPITVTITQSDFTYGTSVTKNGVTLSANMIYSQGEVQGPGSFTTTLGNITSIVVTSNYASIHGEGWSGEYDQKTWTGNASSVSFSGDIQGVGSIVCTIQPSN